jgi:hypothetical protein
MQQTILNKVGIDRRPALLGGVRRDLAAVVRTMQRQMEQDIGDWGLVLCAREFLVAMTRSRFPERSSA